MSLNVPEFDHTPRESLREKQLGGRYNYIDIRESALGSIKNSILRNIAFLNPFALSQASDDDHVGTFPLTQVSVSRTRDTSSP